MKILAHIVLQKNVGVSGEISLSGLIQAFNSKGKKVKVKKDENYRYVNGSQHRGAKLCKCTTAKMENL